MLPNSPFDKYSFQFKYLFLLTLYMFLLTGFVFPKLAHSLEKLLSVYFTFQKNLDGHKNNGKKTSCKITKL